MKIFYLVNYQGKGEAQAIYDAEGGLMHWWYSNDGSWEREYFNPFLERAFNARIEIAPKEIKEKFYQHMKEFWE